MRTLLIAAFTWPALAQFSGPGVNGDGSQVYFSSTLRLRGSSQGFHAKLFRMTGDATLSLFREQDPGRSLGWYPEFFPELVSPQVSADGSVVAFTGWRGCGGGSGCLAVQRAESLVTDSNGQKVISAFGYVNLSPNGRYALFFARNTFGNPIPATELASLGDGTHTPVPYTISPQARRRVANDGTVALHVGGGIRLWRNGAELAVPGARIAPRADFEPLLVIGGDGRRLVYESGGGLVRYDRSTAAEEALTRFVPLSVSIDEDATAVAYVDPGDDQVYLASPTRQLTTLPEGISEVALSGNGRVAILTTRLGRLLRMDLPAARVKELLPRTPVIQHVDSHLAPGSLFQMTGSALAVSDQNAAAPLPRELAGVRVRVGGIDAAIQSVSPASVWFQVPWEVPAGQIASFEFRSGDSPFETPPGTVSVTLTAPHSFTIVNPATGDREYIAVHQDWSGLVTQDRPARPGEIVTLYLNGLGPVVPFVATGEAAPSDSPARITGALHCRFFDFPLWLDSRLYFAGLAPGMIGVYQVTLEVPSAIKTVRPELTCGFDAGSSSIGSIAVAP